MAVRFIVLQCIAILANSVLRYFHAHMIIGGADHTMPPWGLMPEPKLRQAVFTCNNIKLVNIDAAMGHLPWRMQIRHHFLHAHF